MSFLKLHDLQKTYVDGTEAVKGIHLSIDQGEFIVLLGPSGCGKTTTLRMIAGLEIPTAGTITLSGKDVTNASPSERDIGFVFQFYALYPHMTVWQNIAFPLENMGMPTQEIEQTIQTVSEALGITSFFDRHPNTLSGGDQQRVSLARAMVRQPDLYLMDEPLGTLDSEHRLELREFIRKQQLDLNVTAIYVTHDQEEALSLADRIVIMDNGNIRQVGSPTTIYHHPADLFVANFVGSPGMNFVEGTIADHHFVAAKTHIPVPTITHTGPTTLGIRPEFVLPSETGLRARVGLSEYHGSHRLIHLSTPMGKLIMRTSVSFVPPKDNEITVSLAPDQIRLFDTQTGKAVI